MENLDPLMGFKAELERVESRLKIRQRKLEDAEEALNI